MLQRMRLGGIGREFGVARKYLTRHADLDPRLRTLLEARPSPRQTPRRFT